MSRLDRVNAWVGARRSRLAGPDTLRELLVRPSLEARIELLVRTGRIPALGGDAGSAPLDAVEAALRAGLRADEVRLLRDVEGARPRRLLAAAIGIQEGQGLKVLLRGTAFGVPAERLVAQAPATEGLPEERLRALAEATSPEALAERLSQEGSSFAAPLRAALAERDREGLLPAEVAIDRIAFGRVADASRGRGEDAASLSDWLAAIADARNALTLLALGANVPSRDLLVPGGRRIGADAFARLVRAGAVARRRAAAALVPCDPERLVDPASAERLLERAATRRLRLAARRAPLSLAVPLAWLAARREETRRLAVLLRGSFMGLPGDAILDLVEA